jgi:hypothetical protein
LLPDIIFAVVSPYLLSPHLTARSPLLCPSRSPAANGRLCLRGPPAAAGLPGGAAAGARGAGGRGGDARAGVRRRAAVEALRGVRDGGRGARAAPLLLPGGVGARPRQGPRRALAQRRPGLLQLRRLRLRARYYIFFLAFVASPLGPRGPRAPGQSQGPVPAALLLSTHGRVLKHPARRIPYRIRSLSLGRLCHHPRTSMFFNYSRPFCHGHHASRYYSRSYSQPTHLSSSRSHG